MRDVTCPCPGDLSHFSGLLETSVGRGFGTYFVRLLLLLNISPSVQREFARVVWSLLLTSLEFDRDFDIVPALGFGIGQSKWVARATGLWEPRLSKGHQNLDDRRFGV